MITISWQILPQPSIATLNPTSGPAAGGTLVTITGSGFEQISAVLWGGGAIPFTVVNTTTITVVSPAGSGSAIVAVTNASGSSTQTFSYTGIVTPGIPSVQSPLVSGVESESAFSVLRRHFNGALAGPNWDAILAALATADTYVQELAAAVFNQLFKPTASGKYLDVLANEDGTTRDPYLGMTDDIFRELSIELSTGKVTYNSILRILQFFYGKEALRPYVDTSVGPFDLDDGQTLVLKFNDTEFVFEVDEGQYSQVNSVTPAELAVALSIQLQKKGIAAVVEVVVVEGEEIVRIFGPALGLRSSVTVMGGTAVPALGLDAYVDVYDGTVTSGDAYSWIYSVVNNKTQLQLTTASITPKINIQSVLPGDYVVVGLDTATNGWYTIESVSYVWTGSNYVQTVTLSSNIGYTGTLVQQSNESYRFYRPTQHTILNGDRTVVVAQVDGALNVQVPAVAPVSRTQETAGYVAGNPLVSIDTIWRQGNDVYIYTDTPHGLLPGDSFTITGYKGAAGRAAMNGLASDFTPPVDVLMPVMVPFSSPVHGLVHSPYISATATDTAATGALLLARSNGDIVSIGGFDASTVAKNTTIAVHDYTNSIPGNWTGHTLETEVLGDLATGRYGHAGSVLSGVFQDDILVTGGVNAASATIASVEKLVAGTWTTKASMLGARTNHGQVVLDDGRVLVAGGFNGLAIATTEIYDPILDVWTAGPNMNIARAAFAMHKLSDGRVLVIGGTSDPTSSNAVNRTCEVFDGTSWTYVHSMSSKRHSFGSVVLENGDILVLGGMQRNTSVPPANTLNTTEIYTPDTDTWRRGPDMPTQFVTETNFFSLGWVTRLLNRVYYGLAFSSSWSGIDTSTIWWLDTNDFSWNVLPSKGNIMRSRGLSNGSYVLLGGSAANSADDVRYFDAIVGEHTSTTPIGINGIHKVATISDSTSLTFVTPSENRYTTTWENLNTIIPIPDSFTNNVVDGGSETGIPKTEKVASTGMEGVFVVDPKEVIYSAGTTSTSMSLVQGSAYGFLDVASTTDIPDGQGWLILGLGTSQESKPIKYLETIGPTRILLDGFVAPETWSSGISVTCIRYEENYSLDQALWITGTITARLAAEKTVRESVARDIQLNWSVIYPGDRGLGGAGASNSDAAAVWGPDTVEDI